MNGVELQELLGPLSALVACVGAAWLGRQGAQDDSPAAVWLSSRRTRLSAELAFVRAKVSAVGVLGLQAVCFFAGAILLVNGSEIGLLGLLLGLAPDFLLFRARKARVDKIQSQVEGWLAGLSRALESAPSLSEAVLVSTTMCDAPLREEIEVVVNEVKLGRSLARALSALEERARSRTLTLALSTLRVGQMTGGDLPNVLRTAAASLREMERLEGVVRTKTAEGKAQAWVISFIPIPLYFGIQMSDPNYFLPLEETVLGHVLLGVAVLCWLLAGFLARRILAVQI